MNRTIKEVHGYETSEVNYMSKAKRMRKLEQRDAYWRGVKNCIQWIGGVLVGGSMFLYYLLEILDRLKIGGV